jgi:hypothetical protein
MRARAADVICGEAGEWKAVQMELPSYFYTPYSTSHTSLLLGPPFSSDDLPISISVIRHETGRLRRGRSCPPV